MRKPNPNSLLAVTRKALGLKPKEMAARLGISLSYVEKIESGRMKLPADVADALDAMNSGAERMKRARKSLGFTVEVMAALLGCSDAAIKSIESGRLKMSDSMEARLVTAMQDEAAILAIIDQKVAAYRASLIETFRKAKDAL